MIQLVAQMKQLARSKDHQLRLQMYTTLIDATLIALVNEDGSWKYLIPLSILIALGHSLMKNMLYNTTPRQHLEEMSMLHISKAVAQNAGSLWLNPKGKLEENCTKVDSLWSRVKRFV